MKIIKNYFKKVLGISALENILEKLKNQNSLLQSDNNNLKNKLNFLMDSTGEIHQDNKLILHHIKFINSQFSVVSDINMKYEPSVVLIMKRGFEDVVKTYQFNNQTLEEIYRMLEGFGRNNNRIDKPRGFPGPRFRY
jgi:hypothetical protein